MMIDFERTFNPTPEQKRKQKEFDENIVRNAYEKKRCVTCEHFIHQPQPPCGPDCKLGGSPYKRSWEKEKVNDCENYECDTTMWKKTFLKEARDERNG